MDLKKRQMNEWRRWKNEKAVEVVMVKNVMESLLKVERNEEKGWIEIEMRRGKKGGRVRRRRRLKRKGRRSWLIRGT